MAPSLSRRAVLRGLGASAASLVFPLRAWAVAASDPPAVCAGYRPRVAAGWVPAGEPWAFEEAGYDAYLAERVPGGGHWRDEVWIARAVAEADHIVYLPRVSHHTLAFATLGLKLGVGWLREDSRLELHRDADSFAQKFAEVNRLPAIADRLRLVVTDATAVQTTFGPDFGYVARPAAGLVLASTDLLAHDLVAHRWLAWTRAEATHGASAHWLLDGVYRQASLANRCLVQLVWGPGEAARTKSLAAPRVRRPLDDPALAHACRARGGAPESLALEWVDRTPGPAGAAEFLARYTSAVRPVFMG